MRLLQNFSFTVSGLTHEFLLLLFDMAQTRFVSQLLKRPHRLNIESPGKLRKFVEKYKNTVSKLSLRLRKHLSVKKLERDVISAT